jgi:hypothetical protein
MKEIKGYLIADGYMGWVENEKRYRLFETESAYIEEVNDRTEDIISLDEKRREYRNRLKSIGNSITVVIVPASKPVCR